MYKGLLGVIGAAAINFLSGCAVIDKDQKFVYPQIVENLEHRNKHFSLENTVREQGQLYVGASAVEITPNNQQYLAGFNANRKSDGVRDELFSKCVVLAYNNKTVAFVSLDLIGFMHENVDDVRYLVSKIKGNFVDKLIISSTHTHSAPDTIGMWGFGLPFLPLNSGIDKEYVSFLYDKIVESVFRAQKDLKPARMFYASKEISKEKKVSRNYHPEFSDLIDRQLSVLQFVCLDEKTISTLVNYGCHPEAFNQKNKKVTSDFVGVLNSELEKKFGGVSVFFNQSIGGLITTDIDDSKSGDLDYLASQCERIGKTIADETADCLVDKVECKNPKLNFYSAEFFVPVDNKFFRIGNFLGIVAKRDYGSFVKSEVDRIDVGDAQIITVPGEIFPDLGKKIKLMMAGKINFILGLANDELGYIMFPKYFDIKDFSYETTMSPGKNTGLIVEENAVKLLKEK